MRFGRNSNSLIWLVIAGSAAALASACGDDQNSGSPAGGSGGGNAGSRNAAAGARQTSGAGGQTQSPAGAAGEAGEAGEAGQAGSPGTSNVVYLIPNGGGEVEVATHSGNVLRFDFPASAAGKTITLTPDSSASVGWDDGRFQDVIRMAPDGLVFNDPVIVRPQSKDVLLFDYATSGEKSPAQGLPLNEQGDGVKLSHFSTLVVVPASVSCLSTSGWNASAGNAACSAYGSNSTKIDFTCKAPQYCLYISASCCAPAGSTECQLGMPALQLTYTPAGTNNGAYPYCDSGVGNGGASNGGAAGNGGAGGGAGKGGAAGNGGASNGGGAGKGGAAGNGGASNGGGAGSAGAATGGAGAGAGGAGASGAGTAGIGGAASGSGGGSNSTDVPTQAVAAGVSEIGRMLLDGGYIYFDGSSGLARAPVTGGTPVNLGSTAANFDVDATYAYWSDGNANTVQRRVKDASSAATSLAFTGATFFPSEVQEDSGTLYMVSGIKLFKGPSTGGAAVQLVASEPGPHNLIVVGTDLFYATYIGTGTNQSAVVKVPVAGGTPVALISGVAGSVQAIAIAGGFVYYSSSTAIARIPIAGGTAQPLAATGGSTLGVEGNDIFFVTYLGEGVSKLPITGGTVTPLITTADGARGIGVSPSYIYFSSMNGTVPGRGMFRFAR